jgi:hypothetical protein
MPPAISSEIERIGREASVAAAQQAFLYGAVFAALGFIVAHTLPSKRTQELAAAGH